MPAQVRRAICSATDEHQYRVLRVSADRVLAKRRLPRQEDRKSTRLNSSHLVISYAVFCLKKNKRRLTIGRPCWPSNRRQSHAQEKQTVTHVPHRKRSHNKWGGGGAGETAAVKTTDQQYTI